MSESVQKKKERVRPPRVSMTCEVETNGAMVLKELPFVSSVLADLAGDKRRDKKLKDREFATIDRKRPRVASVSMTLEQFADFRFLALFALPEAILLLGVVSWWRRRT